MAAKLDTIANLVDESLKKLVLTGVFEAIDNAKRLFEVQSVNYMPGFNSEDTELISEVLFFDKEKTPLDEIESAILQLNSILNNMPSMDESISDINQYISLHIELDKQADQTLFDLESTKNGVWYEFEFGDAVIKGKTNSQANPSVLLPPNTEISLRLFSPTTFGVATQKFTTTQAGSVLEISPIEFHRPIGMVDSDFDSLPDLAEQILGTNANLPDSDSDGITDASEFKTDQDPLGGRPFATGIIASQPLQGEAKEVVLAGSTESAETQFAYVAIGSYGLAIVDASNFQRPTTLGQLDLPGDAVDVAVDSRLGIAVVAGTTGLHFVDVSDPTKPVLRQSVNVPATQVEVTDGVAYVAAGAGLESYSVQTGELLQVLPLGGNSVRSLAREGSTLYSLDTGGVLHAIDISGLSMKVLDSLSGLPGVAKVFVGDGVAYIGAGDGSFGGFATVDVSDPADMQLLSGVDANNIQGQAIVANGSGLAVSIGTFRGPVGEPIRQVNVLDVRDPARTDQFLTSFDLSANPYSVAIGAGIAFVAGGTAGLQVVNYRAFDNQGQAPTVTLTAPAADTDPTTDGIQAVEGSTIQLKPNIDDDVQVRNVELLVDGTVVSNDVSFPWDLSAVLPTLATGSSTATIQLRATDTGGNTTLSDPLVIELVPDTLAPAIVSTNVPDGSRHGANFRTVRIAFSEEMSEASIAPENFRLVSETGQSIVPVDAQLATNGRSVLLSLPALAMGQYRLVVDGDAVTDRAGNALGTEALTVSTFDITQATIEWIGGQSGNWNDPGNWDQGRIPDATDSVLINANPSATITVHGAPVRVAGIESFNRMSLSTSVQVDGHFVAHESVTMNGAALSGATVDFAPGEALIVTNNTANRLEGVTVNGDLDLGNSDAVLTVKDLVLNGSATLGRRSSLAFDGTQTLAGAATVVFIDSLDYGYLEMASAGTLTLGQDVLVRGGYGALGYSGRFNQAMALINEGTVRADVAGRYLLFGGNAQPRLTSFVNRGTLEAVNGATLSEQAPAFVNEGVLRVGASGALDLHTADWRSPGALINDGGTLNLYGAWRSADVAAITHNGGAVNFYGAIDNRDSTLALGTTPGATPGAWVLRGTTIEGGTLEIAPGEALLITNNTANRLEGVTVNGDLDLGNSDAVLTVKDLVLNGSATLGRRSSLAFDGTQTLAGAATVVFIDGSDYGYLEMASAGTLTLGQDVLVRGGYGALGYSGRFNQAMALVNEGTLRADVAGRYLLFGGNAQPRLTSFVNRGTLEAVNGATLSEQATSFTNEGTVHIEAASTLELYTEHWRSSGALINDGGTLNLYSAWRSADVAGITQQDGAVSFYGAIDNRDSTLALGATPGAWVLRGATIEGGTLEIAPGEALIVTNNTANRLQGVTVNGDLDLGGSDAMLTVKDLVLNGSATLGRRSTLGFDGTQTLAGAATVVFTHGQDNGYLAMASAGTLTLGQDVLVRGGYGTFGGGSPYFSNQPMALINEGTVRADVAGRYLNFGGGLTSVVNRGTLEAVNGATLYEQAASFVNEGVLAATAGGVLNITNLAPNAGMLDAGAGGLININGDFSNDPSGRVRVALGGLASSQFGRISVSGNAALDGILRVASSGGFTPAVGQTFPVLAFASRTGAFGTVEDENPGDGVTYSPIYGSAGLDLDVILG